MTSIDALITLIQTFTRLTSDGIPSDRLQEIEQALADIPGLSERDFAEVSAKWEARAALVTLDGLIQDLRQNATERARHH